MILDYEKCDCGILILRDRMNANAFGKFENMGVIE